MNNKSTENSILFSEIALLMSVHAEESIFGYTATLKEMAVSDNFKVRANAIEALSNLGMADEIPTPSVHELGMGFMLHLPADEKFRHIEKIKPYENIQDTDDYMKVITSHRGWLDFLTEETGLPKENIAHRWITLINEKAKPNQISQAYEKELQQHLKKLSLDFPFQRPRIAAVQTGLDYLLTELIDAEVLDYESIGSYSSIDPLLETKININERPQFVIPLSDSKSRFLGEGWVDQINQTKRATDGLFIYGDNLIIGEFSYVKRLDWGMPTETYSTYCQFQNDTGSGGNNDSNNVYGWYYSEYSELQDASDLVLTIANNSNFDFHLGFMSKWIAFNPKIAISLNWKPSKKGDFAWENTEGDLMVYSVYWRSGNIYMSSRGKESEAAEGWYVVLTPKGKEKIKELNTQFILKKELTRDWFYKSKKSKEINIEIAVKL